jgi:uncharacterized repeat protein (TIGR03803 family)
MVRLNRDSAGNLYGTTFYGGTTGYGAVFKLETAGELTVLHSFNDAPDGAHPIGGWSWTRQAICRALPAMAAISVVGSRAAEPCSSSPLKSGGANSR